MTVQTKPPNQDIQTIGQLFNEQRFAECEVLASELVNRFPESGFGWKALAASLNMQGKHSGALPAIQKAVELLPQDAEAHANLGLTYKARGQLMLAQTSMGHALQRKEGSAAEWLELGCIQHQIGLLPAASASYQQAILRNPGMHDAYNNLGIIQRLNGQLAEAESSLRRSVELQPDSVDALGNLGLVLQEQGRLAEAQAEFLKALRIDAGNIQAMINLGITLREMGRIQDAQTCFQQALQIDPDRFEAHLNLGLILQDQGLLTQAEASHRQALRLRPLSAEVHNNLGDTFRKMGRLADAEAGYREALRLRPGWLACASNLLFTLSYTASDPDLKGLSAAREYGRLASRMAGAPFSSWHARPDGARLRVGFVSGDFRNHPVGYFFESLASHIDRSKLELFAFSSHHVEDALTERIRPLFAHWHSLVGLDDAAAAQQIHDARMDVLIDLSGHTSHNRLAVFAYRPAPVQISWLGYFGTTGVEQMDYVIADELGVPPQGRRHFTEQVVYLPDTRLCLSPPTTRLDVAPLPALHNGHVTFACFQNLSKLEDGMLQLWARVLTALPTAQLSLRCAALADPATREELTRRLQRLGIDSARVAMQGGINRHLYLAMHGNVDMILDTFPYPGGTTTCESLWMGVPTLTLAGQTMLSRQGASLLSAAGLHDWIATDAEDYVAKAVAHASDLDRLSALRMRLREQVRTSALFDAERFARNFEALLLRLVRSDPSTGS